MAGIPYDSITPALVAREFDARSIQRARGYLTAIEDLSLSGADRLVAQVQGSESEPYRVEIQFLETGRSSKRQVSLEAFCTCPVGYRCKHAAAVLLAVAAGRRPNPVSLEVLHVVQRLRTLGREREGKPRRAKAQTSALYYVLWEDGSGALVGLSVEKGRIDPALPGGGRVQSWSNFKRALVESPSFVTAEDAPILRHLLSKNEASWGMRAELGAPEDGEVLLAMAHTGRLYLARTDTPPKFWTRLSAGPKRQVTPTWQPVPGGQGAVRLVSELTPPAQWCLPGVPPCYVDPDAAQVGLAVTEAPQDVLALLSQLPPLNPLECSVVAQALAEVAPTLPRPAVATDTGLVTVRGPPLPVLEPMTFKVWQVRRHRGYQDSWSVDFDAARVRFRYGDIDVDAGDDQVLFLDAAGGAVQVERDAAAEAGRLKELAGLGLLPLKPNTLRGRQLPPLLFGLASEADWQQFASRVAGPLKAAGWLITGERTFRHFSHAVSDWQLEVEEAEGGFTVALGIELEGRRLDLVPLLRELFHRDPRWTSAKALAGIPDTESIRLTGPEGERIQMPADRIKPIARTLAELLDVPAGADGRLQLSRYDAPRLAELAPDTSGLEAVRRFAARIPGGCTLAPVECPAGFDGTLRPYQLEGLAWLQHLTREGLAGILADDMGLGKTAQTLAHLLAEKQAGRLDRPSLIVVPTSLIYNWRQEAARFAPELRLLSLHGPERHDAQERIPAADLCLTTYSLLWRDEAVLRAQPWHLLILDEAQSVKNIASRGAQVLRGMNARHRLCLTGTPLENHLGELWTQFDFLLPGFLGDQRSFNRLWRTPIEKQGDRLRAELLARRVRPFLLRRTKETVARELPPKSVSVCSVELEGRQRDLYETVRAAMDVKVRDALRALGLARSHLVILEALLKLRQVCCDPRLLKQPEAARVKERAKLDLLMGMLPPLIEEGRRVLLFSQFTGMLDLVEPELRERGLAWVRLDGSTRDREQPIARFQAGEVPLFLVSLKAGGVGLNLTAADTVIHYDPWWNPAAENQATDRAHRIGQDKPVFVYKLIVAGSIEERILALQARKAELAASILEEGGAGRLDIDEATLAELLAPLGAG